MPFRPEKCSRAPISLQVKAESLINHKAEKLRHSGSCITAPTFGIKINHFPSVDLICDQSPRRRDRESGPGIEFQGTLDLDCRCAGNPLWFDYYEVVAFNGASSKEIPAGGMDFHFCGVFSCVNGRLKNFAADVSRGPSVKTG